jgi:hypothetical protein
LTEDTDEGEAAAPQTAIIGSVDFTTINQHQLVEAVFRACDGAQVDDLLPQGYKGKKADIVFSGENVIAEVKSLTSERAPDRG